MVPRLRYKVLSVDELGNGMATDGAEFEGEPVEYRFKGARGVDVGDIISGPLDLADATLITEIVIEKGRNREGERKKFESVKPELRPRKNTAKPLAKIRVLCDLLRIRIFAIATRISQEKRKSSSQSTSGGRT